VALAVVWQSGIIPPDRKRDLDTPIWKGKWDWQNCNNYCGATLLRMPSKILVHLLQTQKSEQSGFAPKYGEKRYFG